MQYNVEKCHILHLGKENRRHEYQLGGRTLEACKCEKDVGVIINDVLKPSLQCARAAAKANQVLGQIARGVCFRDKDNMLRLYKTYVRPHLEYCQAACSPWLLGDQKILEQVQHRAVKLMTNLRSKTYEGKLKELGLTTRQNTGFLNFEKTLKSNLELRRNQFSQRGVDDWNLLIDWVKQATSVNSFKNNLDRHLYPM